MISNCLMSRNNNGLTLLTSRQIYMPKRKHSFSFQIYQSKSLVELLNTLQFSCGLKIRHVMTIRKLSKQDRVLVQRQIYYVKQDLEPKQEDITHNELTLQLNFKGPQWFVELSRHTNLTKYRNRIGAMQINLDVILGTSKSWEFDFDHFVLFRITHLYRTRPRLRVTVKSTPKTHS